MDLQRCLSEPAHIQADGSYAFATPLPVVKTEHCTPANAPESQPIEIDVARGDVKYLEPERWGDPSIGTNTSYGSG